MWQRRTLIKSGLGMALLGTSAAHAQGRRRQPVRLVVQNGQQIKQLPLLLAHHLGYFKAEGLDVTLVTLPAHVQSLEAVLTLPGDVFAASFERTALLQARGQPVRAFVALAYAPQVALGVSPAALAAQAPLTELAGARIGGPAQGGLSHRVAQLILLRAGLKPTDVHFVDVPSGQAAVAAFRSGAIEALSHTDPVITGLEQQGMIRLVSDTRVLRQSQQVFGGPVICACLSAHQDYIDRRPDVVQGLTNGVVRALKWLQTASPMDLVSHLPPGAWWADRALFLKAFTLSRDTLSNDGQIPDEAPLNVLRAMQRLELQQPLERISAADTYTNAFVSRARQQFRV
jgi:NitT/TauT family transport system substrate-binding protein